jgi:plastocyanin
MQMASYSWTTGVSGDWKTDTLWTPNGVPGAADDVTIDAATTLTAYTVTIAQGETETVNSLSMNGTNELAGTNNPNGYYAAELELDGTLTFAPGSAGLLDGSLQTFIHVASGSNASIVNGGTINGFLQVEGNLLLTGTNGVYITNDLQALAGTVTIDTKSIAEMSGNVLFDGIFEAKGPGAVVNLGGALEGLVVNIGTVEGPPLNPGGWTELTFNDPSAVIDEWNGTGYVSVETTLTEINGGGTVDVLDGRNYTTANILTINAGAAGIAPGMLNLQAATVTTGGLDINGGVVQGFATIVGDVANNGTLIAVGGTMDLTGSLTGTGAVAFDFNQQLGTLETTGATLVVNGVAAGQTIVMNGDDTLQINAPASFAGTIKAGVGDKIVLSGVTATSATVSGGSLVVFNGSQTVATLAVAGDYTGDHVTVTGSTLAIAAGAVGPTITGTAAGQAVTDQTTITPFSHVVIADPNVGQTQTVTVTLSAAANGTLTNLGGGSYDATTGVYTATGSAAAVTAALAGLVFTPTAHEVAPGQSVTTSFAISDTDTGLANVTDAATTVIATAGATAPTIGGTVAGQAVSDTGTIKPFAGVVIGDANIGQTETVTVTLSAVANGALSNLGGGSYDAATGVYTDVGSAAAVTAALTGLVFTPTTREVAPGQTVTTGFAISDTDSALVSASDTKTTVVATTGAVAPTISGTVADQAVSDTGTITPFASVVISDANIGQTETVTVTMSAVANGALSNLGGGRYDAATGVYTDVGSAAAVTAALAGLVFTPTTREVAPGQTVTTGFAISDTDSALASASDTKTTVVATTGVVAPTISGSVADQAVSDTGTITPFASVVIGDANLGQTATVTVALSAAANGTLSNLGSGIYNATTGVYAATGSAAAVTAALNGLVFTPTAHEVAAGQTVTTSFRVSDTDSAGASATDVTTSVIATATATVSSAPFADSDFNGDGTADVLYRNLASGDLGYSALPSIHTQGGWFGYGLASTAYTVVGVGDFNHDGTSDILFRNNATGSTGYLANPLGGGHGAWVDLGASSTAYSIVGDGDFNGDGTADLLFRNSSSGDMGMFLLHASGPNTWQDLGSPSLLYSVVGIGDFTGNGKADILFQNTATGDTGYYQPGIGGAQGVWVGLGAASTAYSVVGVGDFNGDGTSDILFRNNASGAAGYLAMPKGGGHGSWVDLGVSSTAYSVVAVGDYTGNGVADILFRNQATGDTGYFTPPAGSSPGVWHGLGQSSTAYSVIASPTYG